MKKALLATLLLSMLFTMCKNTSTPKATRGAEATVAEKNENETFESEKVDDELTLTNINITTDGSKEADAYAQMVQYFQDDIYSGIYHVVEQFTTSDSPYADSVRIVWEKMEQNRKHLLQRKEHAAKKGAIAYINDLNLPTYNAISGHEYNLHKNSYKRELYDFDYNLIDFKKGYWDDGSWIKCWYLSKQYETKDFVCIMVSCFDDCISEVMLYTVDKDFNVLDSLPVMFSGCYSPATYAYYNSYKVTDEADITFTSFEDNNIFTVTRQIYYELHNQEDSGEQYISEVGEEIKITYSIAENGMFNEIKRDLFEKEYVQLVKNSEQQW